jgi:hypothetical protein
MCLGGSSAPTYQPPPQRQIEEGPESPNDKVNNMDVDNVNDRSQQDTYRQANRGATATKQAIPKGQSSSKTDKAY